MEKLKEKLEEFERNISNISSEEDLQKSFKNLAPAFLYGGYIQVRNDYRVYIRTVEFYFHSEKENGIHDPIVYHRNGRDLKTAPYFPPMTLHAHNSGFDITFESEFGKYRASALIRAYEVVDKDGYYLKWENIIDNKGMFIQSHNYAYNKQSTYLYALLNGFAFGNDNDIKWKDSPRAISKPITEKPRQNVFKSKCEWEYEPIKGVRDRIWSFTREEHV